MAEVESSIDDLLGPMSNLGITAEAHLTTSFLAIEAFVRSTERSALLAKEFQALQIRDGPAIFSRVSLAQAQTLHSHINRLEEATRLIAGTADNINKITVRSTVLYLLGLADQSSTVKKLLAHFDQKIIHIATKALETSDIKGAYVCPKIAEDCYQASLDGQLDANDYFTSLDEATLEWPYDPDFESEEYYEHEDRLNLDEDYRKGFFDEYTRKSERQTRERQRERQSWTDFWLRVLNRCPGGPKPQTTHTRDNE
ncbi:hypothetical protein VP1G_04591 [Cytospora mali]|uniref:Uncharacterized protein n=1 Tax=Cytospora mali TaxID=578113 RepID=A0A194V067_CYTMA|nr:hypothetical protein VP1G_04591 [Valsa mali var. pyri (nom. inval.)]